MTGFVIGVLSSLVASILFDLAKKIYLRLQKSSVEQLTGWFYRIFAVQNSSTRVPLLLIAVILTFFNIVNLPQCTVFAPSQDKFVVTKAKLKGLTATIDNAPIPTNHVLAPCVNSNEPIANHNHDPIQEVINKLPIACG